MMEIEKIKAELASNEEWQKKFVSSIVSYENSVGYPYSKIRDNVTGPLCDLLFKGQKFTKKLQNGITFNFIYNSKIAREFLLSYPETPNHVWEPQTTKLLLHLTKDAKNVVVAGAYFGDQSILIANNIKESGICHTFEPNKVNSDMIVENARINNLKNMVINPSALWNKSDVYLVFDGEDALASTIETSSNSEGSLKTITIDDYVKKNAVGKVNVIMIDVEGSEKKVIEGSLETIKRDKPVVIFETHSLYDDWSKGLIHAPSVSLMTGLGYTVFAVREFHQNIDTEKMPIELLPLDKTYCEIPPHHGFNLLAVPDVSLIEGNLFKIVEGLSPKLILTKQDPLFSPSNG